MEGRLPARSDQARRQSGMYEAQNAPSVNNCAQDRERYSICTAPAWGFLFVCLFLALCLLPDSGIRDKHKVLVRFHASVMTGLWFSPQCSCLMPRGWCWSLRGEGRSLVTTLRSCQHLALAGAAFERLLGSVAIVAVCFAFLSSPDGSYTEEQSQESEVKVLATDFDDEFDDEEPLPAIGTCKALYTFEGNTNCLGPSSLSVVRLSFEAFRTFLSGRGFK